MSFDFQGFRVNLLDTPGHKDFGEDTYRTLIAADSAAMLIDAAKGVEDRTKKLFEVCSLRKIPIFTFANKMDREGKEPLELIDDVERTLGLHCYPVTWPIGMGDRFAGLYHRLRKKVYFYTKGEEKPELVDVAGPEDEKIKSRVHPEVFEKFVEDLSLLEGALIPFDEDHFLAGDITPMTFGSAKFSWGVDLFLELFSELAPEPGTRHAQNVQVDPLDKDFSGFVFKIQANMDRKHRDRVAFVRVCSGEFKRGMKVYHTRLDRELRLSYANSFMARDRDTVEEAYPGDIVGVIDTGYFQIGDTITEGKKIVFDEMPRFSPECFARLSIKDPLKRKQMQKAVRELSEEGTVQIFVDPLVGEQDPVLGVVGELQFDVLLFRLNDEYKLDVKLERLPFSVARWPRTKDDQPPTSAINGGAKLYRDVKEQPVVLLNQEWDLRWLERENPDLQFHITGH
jgi:peptide chain release factor 3